MSRAIDNYTFADPTPRKSSERGKAKPKIVVTRDMTPDYEREAKRDTDRNKAQPRKADAASHSPLPWTLETWKYGEEAREVPTLVSQGKDATAQVLDLWCMDDRQGERDANAALIVRAVNHADKLAEALKMACRVIEGENLDEAMSGEYEILTDALAAYEAAQ